MYLVIVFKYMPFNDLVKYNSYENLSRINFHSDIRLMYNISKWLELLCRSDFLEETVFLRSPFKPHTNFANALRIVKKIF